MRTFCREVAGQLDRNFERGISMTGLHRHLAGAILAIGLASASPVSAQVSNRIKGQPSALAGDGLMQARYVVEAINFKALNETGIDFLGSDEIVVRYAITDKSMFTGIYGSVDTGETHPLRSGQQCIYPAIDPDGTYNHRWACNARGAPGPISFQITLYEFDGFLRGLLTNPLQFCLSGGNDLLSGCGPQLESTAIGSGYVALTEAELAEALPTVGMSVERIVPIRSAYQVNIRITRTRGTIIPPVGDEPPVGPVEPSQPCVPTPGIPCP